MSIMTKVRVVAVTALVIVMLTQAGRSTPQDGNEKARARDDQSKVHPRSAGKTPDYRAYEKYRDYFKAAEDAIQPLPIKPIPDDPPPHEGAMIDVPYIIEVSDVLVVDLLEAFANRPVRGQRVVRADGTISLGFYGNVHVRGLTLEQAKAKILLHFRYWLSDEALGLFEELALDEEEPMGNAALQRSARPLVPPQEGNPAEKPKADPPRPSGVQPKPTAKSGTHRRSQVAPRNPQSAARIALISARQDPPNDVPPAPTGLNTVEVPTPGGGKVSITITIDQQRSSAVPPPPPGEVAPIGDDAPDVRTGLNRIPPHASSALSVDVVSSRSKAYYVQGSAVAPGKFPCTGNETVLDAINHAKGISPTAAANVIKLVRPARGGIPARVYNVDLKAIVEDGDVRKNYQVFPGDRIFVAPKPGGRQEAAE